MKKIFLCFLCLLLVLGMCVGGCACGKRSSALAVLTAIKDSEIGLPAGRIYLSGATVGEAEYASDNLISSLYGGGSMPPERDGWLEFAIFLSSGQTPCELAVFLCASPMWAYDTAKMLCRRLDTLKHALKDSLYADRVNAAEVIISGNFCLMLLSSDVSAAKKIALSEIG